MTAILGIDVGGNNVKLVLNSGSASPSVAWVRVEVQGDCNGTDAKPPSSEPPATSPTPAPAPTPVIVPGVVGATGVIADGINAVALGANDYLLKGSSQTDAMWVLDGVVITDPAAVDPFCLLADSLSQSAGDVMLTPMWTRSHTGSETRSRKRKEEVFEVLWKQLSGTSRRVLGLGRLAMRDKEYERAMKLQRQALERFQKSNYRWGAALAFSPQATRRLRSTSSAGANSSAQPIAKVGTTSSIMALAWSL